MRCLVQRVSSASVSVDGAVQGQIGPGMLILVCAMQGDTEKEANWLARKAANLRIFRDAERRMNLSLLDVCGEALIVSQFTLSAEIRGNRPGFSSAAPPEKGRQLYEYFSNQIAALGIPVANGVFGADMQVALVNDGPVTIWLDTNTH